MAADSAQTVDNILTAVNRLLDRDGTNTFSLRAVAREAGISLGTVSYYFPSADELWEACLEAHYGRVIAFAARYHEKLESGAAWNDMIREAAYEGYRFALRERPLLRLTLVLSARRGGLSDPQEQSRTATLKAIAARWRSDTPPRDLLMRFQTVVYACVRFACSSVEERVAITGATSEAAADEAIAQHLSGVAVALLSAPLPA